MGGRCLFCEWVPRTRPSPDAERGWKKNRGLCSRAHRFANDGLQAETPGRGAFHPGLRAGGPQERAGEAR